MSMKRKPPEEAAGPSTKRTAVDFPPSRGESRQHEIQSNIQLGPAYSPASSNGIGEDDGSVFSADSFFSLDSSSPLTLAPTQTQTAATSVASAATRTTKRFPSDLKRLQCPIEGCKKTFNRPCKLTAHLRSHNGDRLFKCHLCDKDYLEEKHLKQHIKGSHSQERKYACTQPGCGKLFLTGTRLKRHVSTVHEGAERFRCRGYEGCSQAFRKHNTLARHIRVVHLGQAGYPCRHDNCQGEFHSASALRRHVDRDHGELKFWCDECGVQDEDEDEDVDVDGSKQSAPDSGGHTTRVGFTTLTLLQTHIRLEHINCMFCDARCSSQGELERHMELHHSGTNVEERKTVPCGRQGCTKMFTRVANRNIHVSTVHEGFRFVCGHVDTFETPDIADWNWLEEGCGDGFVSKAKLVEHVRFVHLGRQRPATVYSAADLSAREDTIGEMCGAQAKKRDIACTVDGCEALFIRFHDLSKHLEKEHEATTEATTEAQLAGLLERELSDLPPPGADGLWDSGLGLGLGDQSAGVDDGQFLLSEWPEYGSTLSYPAPEAYQSLAVDPTLQPTLPSMEADIDWTAFQDPTHGHGGDGIGI